MENQERKEQVNQMYNNFCCALVPYGSSDLRTALEWLNEMGENEDKLMELIHDFSESTGTNAQDLDVCYLVLDYALQTARSEIENVIDKDIQNDLSFDVHSNYMCSSMNFKDSDKEELIGWLSDLEKEELEELFSLDVVNFFFNQIDLSIEEITEKEEE